MDAAVLFALFLFFVLDVHRCIKTSTFVSFFSGLVAISVKAHFIIVINKQQSRAELQCIAQNHKPITITMLDECAFEGSARTANRKNEQRQQKSIFYHIDGNQETQRIT